MNILCTMGLPAIDESLDMLLKFFDTMEVNFIGESRYMAMAIGSCLALCVGSYECWMMMLGRRGIDVMKILRIVGISLCITSSSLICGMLKIPGQQLENVSYAAASAKNEQVAAMEQKVAQKQAEYLTRLRNVQDSIANAEKIAEIGEDAAWYEELVYNVSNLGTQINNLAQRAVVATETKISEWVNDIIRFLGQLIFQMTYYGILVAQRIFINILGAFCPLMFALSLAPAFSSAWSQWMSKYLSLSLWGFVTYTCIYYIDALLIYNLEADIKAYDSLMNGNVNSWGNIGTLGLQGIGSNCMYVMGMLVGAYILRMVPEVSSWLIPGGVSSGAGQAAGGAVMQGTQSTTNLGTNVVGSTASFAGRQAAKSLSQRGIHDTKLKL